MAKSSTRSTDPKDYQNLKQAIGAMSKVFADGWEIPLHHHARDQLLFAARGVMRLRTDRDAWIVPLNSAVYIPAGTWHAVRMHGDVDMRTLYIDNEGRHGVPPVLTVIAVSNLLRELILALSEEPVDYAPGSRAAHIASLIEVEIGCAEALTINVPLPVDPRLQRVCAQLLANPADRRTLDAWSEVAGASPRTLARLFERDLGMSFNRWRQRMRFQNALEALSNDAPVSLVAQAHGYNSPSAFTFAFSKEMGFAPSEISPTRPSRV